MFQPKVPVREARERETAAFRRGRDQGHLDVLLVVVAAILAAQLTVRLLRLLDR